MTGPIQPQLVVAALVVLSCGPAFAAHAKRPPADHKAVPAVAEAEPAVLKKIMAAHWQLAGALPGLPQLQVVHNEALEFQDFVQYAFDGGALRLCVSPGPRQNDIFALLVDTRVPRYASFSKLASTERYTTYRQGAYVAVLPLRPVSQKVFESLRAKQWTADELGQLLGVPSYRWHVHGAGHLGLTYIPQGLSFIGEPAAPVAYQLHAADVEEEWGEQQNLDLSLPPLRSLSELKYLKLQTDVREGFAKDLLSQRERIDQALAHGKRSPDGRFVVGHANLAGGMDNAEELVLREGTKPEQRIRAPHFINDKGYLWLNPRTVIFQVNVGDLEFYALDAPTGTMKQVAKAPNDSPRPVAELGVSGPQRFWYKTADGGTHEVTVETPKPHTTH